MLGHETIFVACSQVYVSNLSRKPDKMIALSFLLSICFLWTGAEGQNTGDLRLVARNGRTSTTSTTLTAGRLEVYYNGQWGTVCDNNFSTRAANIACRQLGFAAGYYDYETIGSTYTSFSASSSAPVWLDSLSCSFTDTRLIDCAPFGTIGSTSCSHTKDIALYCLGNGALRLSSYGIYDTFAGRVEVYYNGEWGTVCNDFFGLTEANVACQQLGYGSSLNYGTVGSLGYSRGSGTIWLDNVDCSSSDLMLSSCSHNGFGNNNCFHSEDVAVSCSSFDINTSIFTTAVIVGIVVAVVVPLCCIGICVTIIVIAVCTGACAAGAASSRRRRNVTTTTAVPSATATVVTSTGTSSQQTAAGFTPQAGYTPYPSDLGKKELQQYPGGDPAYPPQAAPPYPTSGYTPVNP